MEVVCSHQFYLMVEKETWLIP